MPAQPLTVLAALGIGAWASLTWPERNIGLAVCLTMLAAGLLMWVVARHRRDPWTIACAVLAAVLATTTMIRDGGGVVALAVLVGVVVAAAGLTRARTLLSVPLSVIAWPLSGLRGLPLLGRTITATSKVSKLWPILRTVGFSLVALALFGGLFASGDALFGSWAEALVPDLGWDTIVARTFVLALVAGVALTGAYLALNPPPVADVALPEGRRAAHRWEWGVPVGIVVALFAGFLVAQATAMWGGHDYLERTTGLTYAEYVHQGFGQLTVATFLTVVVVALTMHVAARDTARDRLLIRLLLGALCVLTLAVVASALYRMSLYQDAFGYTVLRVFVDGFELWLGLVIVFLLVAGVRLSGWWVPRAVLVSAAVFALVFAAMNPDAWVAGRNIDRFEAGSSLDTGYLSTLGADATPVIVDRLPAEMASCITSSWSGTPVRDRRLAGLEPRPQPGHGRPRHVAPGSLRQHLHAVPDRRLPPVTPKPASRRGVADGILRGMDDRTVLVLNGPNLNLLGEREPEVYGSATLADVEALCRETADAWGLVVDFRQTNHEGTLVDWVQEGRAGIAGIVVNAAGYTHTSVALRDALSACRVPRVEVHISDIHAREEFRHHSYLTDVCDHHVIGHGVQGYAEAVEWVAERRARA